VRASSSGIDACLMWGSSLGRWLESSILQGSARQDALPDLNADDATAGGSPTQRAGRSFNLWIDSFPESRHRRLDRRIRRDQGRSEQSLVCSLD
jgi:hypothetical protein